MSPETFNCPACVKHFPYMPDLVGMRIECPDCQYPFIIQAPNRRGHRMAKLEPAFALPALSRARHTLGEENDPWEPVLNLLPEDEPLPDDRKATQPFPLAPYSSESYTAITVPPATPTFTPEDEQSLRIRSARPAKPARPLAPMARPSASSTRYWSTQDLVLIIVGLCTSLLSVQLLFSTRIRAIVCFLFLLAGLATAGFVVLKPHLKLLIEPWLGYS